MLVPYHQASQPHLNIGVGQLAEESVLSKE